MEFSFVNFQTQFKSYKENADKILEDTLVITSSDEQALYLLRVYNEYQNLDIKIRLAFGISEIKLNPAFVSDKEEDLKRCHLLYYKLADLWFAYEAYIKFYTVVKQITTEKDRIKWLDNKPAFNDYSNSPIISAALNQVNNLFSEFYISYKKELILYLQYCKEKSSKLQKNRLINIISKIDNESFSLTNTEVLTIIYAIRNNFVHNGETTIVPDNFGFRNKRILLDILYPYLCLVLLNSINITCDNMKNT